MARDRSIHCKFDEGELALNCPHADKDKKPISAMAAGNTTSPTQG